MTVAPALARRVERRGAAGQRRGPSRSVRVGAALLAALITWAFVHLLRGVPLHRDDAAPRKAAIAILLPRERPPRIAPAPAAQPNPTSPAQNGMQQASKAATKRSSIRQAAPTAFDQTAPPARAVDASPAESPATMAAPASAPLDLSDRVIQSAAAQSKGAVRKLAEGSGQQLDTPRPSKDQLLATVVAEAGVPGCLRPDALKHDSPKIGPIALGGIFAVPFVAHAAITGKCKP